MIWFVLSPHITVHSKFQINSPNYWKALKTKLGQNDRQTDNDKDYSPSVFTDRELNIFLCTIIYRASTTLYHDSYEVRGFIWKTRNGKVRTCHFISHWNCTGLLVILVENVLYIHSKKKTPKIHVGIEHPLNTSIRQA